MRNLIISTMEIIIFFKPFMSYKSEFASAGTHSVNGKWSSLSQNAVRESFPCDRGVFTREYEPALCQFWN